MSLTKRLTEYVSACFTGLWVQSHEHEDALTEMAHRPVRLHMPGGDC